MRLHWSLPIGMLVFTGFSFAPGAWLAFLLLVLSHELGHAYAVRRAGARILSVDVHGFGGVCSWRGSVSPLQRAIIASGGVAAQLLLLVPTLLVATLARPSGAFVADFLYVLWWTNLWMIALNLLPFPPLDGAEAWALPRLLLAARRAAPRRPSGRTSRPYLRAVDDVSIDEDTRRAADELLRKALRDRKERN